MSKTSLKKRIYGSATALVLVTFSALWYITGHYLDVGTNQVFETLKSKGLRVTFQTPALSGISWRNLGHYRHYERLCVEGDNMSLLIPLCTLHMSVFDLIRQRLSFQSRGTIRISTPKATSSLEKLRGKMLKTEDGWSLKAHVSSGKVLHQGQALFSLENLSIRSLQGREKDNASIHVHLTSAVSFLSPLSQNKETRGSVALQAATNPEKTTISHYSATFSDISIFGQGHFHHTSPHTTGALEISLKGLDYNTILLLYTLSLRFGKTSELNSFLDRLAQRRLEQTEKFTLIIQPNQVYLKEFPFIRFDFPPAF
jgi:hypothetical protein